ncbi:MAG: hypothetical protein V4760_00050 [Bdellovibrionota bacterium]
MSPKKKKRPQAAQALIDQLLDESSSQPKTVDSRREEMSERYDNESISLSLDENPKTTPPVPFENDFPSISRGSIDSEAPLEIDLSLDISKPYELDPIAQANKTAIAERTQMNRAPEGKKSGPAPFDGTRPVVTQMSRREERSVDDPDFSLMTAQDPNDEATMQIAKSAPPSESADQTLRASRDIRQSKPNLQEAVKPVDRGGATEIRGGGFKLAPSSASPQGNAISASSAVFASSEAALKQSESLRIAQSRITELESELERLRRENEDLAAAGETLRRRTDELISKAESLEIKEREGSRIAEEERKVFRGQLQAKDRENAELRARVEEIELRLESNFKKIRVRERELEHRLEIVKMESLTQASSKDKMILELKRQLDQMIHENDLAKAKSQEMYNQNKDKQETIRRVVRALRIALTILEGDDETVVPLKKAE